jgi:quercetin dioxygenase-like cupin family protein
VAAQAGKITSMAWPGQEIVNRMTGERIAFRRTGAETGGELLEMDDFWTRPGHRAPEHAHPQIQERWEVIAGTASFQINGITRVAGPGEVVLAEPGVRHMAWNASTEPVHLRIQMRPALQWEIFVERLFALASAGRSGEGPDQASLLELVRSFPQEIAL